jgi:catechol 2,3-dioxygenase-like lactoylglutathione lyase family enzyme
MTKLHHVGILTSNIQQSIDWFADCFGCPKPKVTHVDKPGLRLKTAMLPIGSAGYIQIIQPLEGPGVSELRAQGDGALYEIALEVEDIEEFHDRLTEKGIVPTDFVGNPLSSNFVTAASGTKYFYLPLAQTRGTRIEVIQPAVQQRDETDNFGTKTS